MTDIQLHIQTMQTVAADIKIQIDTKQKYYDSRSDVWKDSVEGEMQEVAISDLTYAYKSITDAIKFLSNVVKK